MTLQPEGYSINTGEIPYSPRKLNMLARQIGGMPIDAAMLQLQFSKKKPSRQLKEMLARARDEAEAQGLERGKLIVCKLSCHNTLDTSTDCHTVSTSLGGERA